MLSRIPQKTFALYRFYPWISRQKFILFISFLALLVETGLTLLEPWPLKFIFDNILGTSNRVQSIPLLDNLSLSPIALLTLLTVSMVAIAVLSSIFSYLSTFGMALATLRILAEIRGNLYSHIQRLSLSFHSQHKTGDLITRLTADIDHIRIAIVKTVLPLLTNSIALAGMIAIMFWMNQELTLIVLIVSPLFLLFISRLIREIRHSSRKHRQHQGVLAAMTGETLGAIKIVQAFSLHEVWEALFFQQNTLTLDQGARSLKLSALLQRTVRILIALTVALVLWRGSYLAIQKTLTPGELLVFITYLRNAFDPLRKLSNQVGEVVKATASAERILDVLDYEPHVRDHPNAKPAQPFRGAIRFEGVSFGYETGREILRDISLDIVPGQQVAIVGPSGSGKSTLISLLLRLYDPTGGRILIDGKDIRDYTLDSLRQQISVVLQESVLFAVSVRENIAYGNLSASERAIERAAELANAHDFIQHLADGYDTILGERGSTLSGGQRQRIAIARAAIRQAPIIILDEPTTGLDNASERAVTEALQRLTTGKTTFTISHNLQSVENADLILYLENGRIVEQGTHGELLDIRGRYARLYRESGSKPERFATIS
jgi:ATP-binding cassette, subfamily B, bacterial